MYYPEIPVLSFLLTRYVDGLCFVDVKGSLMDKNECPTITALLLLHHYIM